MERRIVCFVLSLPERIILSSWRQHWFFLLLTLASDPCTAHKLAWSVRSCSLLICLLCNWQPLIVVVCVKTPKIGGITIMWTDHGNFPEDCLYNLVVKLNCGSVHSYSAFTVLLLFALQSKFTYTFPLIKILIARLWSNPRLHPPIGVAYYPYSHLLTVAVVYTGWWWISLRSISFHRSSRTPRCQQWDTVRCLISVFQVHSSGDSPNPVFVFPPCRPDWSLIGAGCWQEAVSQCDVWSGMCASQEVNYTTFKTLLYLIIHNGANHVQDSL